PPCPQTPTTTAQSCGEEALVPINIGTRCFAPSHVEGMWPGMVQEGGACSPPLS
ncbi:unnamed protein product, partial [Staurois parvus]